MLLARTAPVALPSTPATSVDTYYARAAGLSGDALLQTLRSITTKGQHDLDYDAARDQLFGVVDDPTSTDRVADIYSGRVFDGIHDVKSAAANAINTEHLWPQSLGATGDARSDLHHLMSADVATNNQRGNLPYGVVVDPSWTGEPDADGHAAKLGTDAEGHHVFEPRVELRGDIARALLYFDARYGGRRPERFSNREFLQELTTYERWNDEDPPDATELARNAAIAALQGNRNPFVDHPEYVARIGAAWVAGSKLRRTAVANHPS